MTPTTFRSLATTSGLPFQPIRATRIVDVDTRNVRSATDFAERLFEAVQRALAPRLAASATAWFTHYTLVNLYRLDADPYYRQVADGYWRELIGYSIRDLARSGAGGLCFSDLRTALNTIRRERGREEVIELVETLKAAQRRYPHAFTN
jgi:hypothetical protein